MCSSSFDGESMKKCFGIIVLLILMTFSNAFCQTEQQRVVSLFEDRVNIFHDFFKSNPLLLDKQKYSSSPSGYIFFYRRYSLEDISFDIRRTNSLVSPYSAYIDVATSVERTIKCGDVKGDPNTYFSTLDIARMNKDKRNCWAPVKPEDIRFYFAYQNNQWVYQRVVSATTGTTKAAISTALGIQAFGCLTVEGNDHWKRLIK
jgi:hypothetical protein